MASLSSKKKASVRGAPYGTVDYKNDKASSEKRERLSSVGRMSF